MEVHRCRFVDYQPAAINALAFTPRSSKPTLLACGRSNGDVEIWNPKNEWVLEKVIPGGENVSVEALVFTHQTSLSNEDEFETVEEKETERKRLRSQPPRLFSAGLNANIIEWNLDTLNVLRYADSHGGAIWCMAANHANTVLAIGCDDGCVRLFDIADNELTFIKSFDKQNGRILSLSWSHDDKMIVTGASDSSVRRWSVSEGRSLGRMTVDRVRREDTLVWAVTMLKDGTIVSGDSLGHVKFWDGRVGTMLQTFHAHDADVMCLTASAKGDIVFTSGVDRKIVQFRSVDAQRQGEKQQKGKKSKWLISGNRKYHSHDVRAMALEEMRPVDTLVTGGVDVSIVVCSAQEFPNGNQRRLPCLPQKPVISLSRTRRLLMCRNPNSVKVWRLGKAAQPGQSCLELDIGQQLELLEPQQAILEMHVQTERNLTASAISEDGQWITVADVEEIKLFRVEQDGDHPGQLNIAKQRGFFPSLLEHSGSSEGFGATALTFTPDSNRLIIATSTALLYVVDLSEWRNGNYAVLRRFGHHCGLGFALSEDEQMDVDDQDTRRDTRISTITSLAVSADGKCLASGDLLNRIHIFDIQTLHYQTSLPTFDAPFTSITFSPQQPGILFVGLANQAFYIYDINLNRLTPWSRQNSQRFPAKFLQLKDKIQGFAFNPARPNTVVVWGVNYMCLVDLEKDPGDHGAILNINKRKRIERIKENAKITAIEKRKKRYEQLGITTPMPEPPKFPSQASSPPLDEQGPDESTDGSANSFNFQILHKFQPMMFLDFLSEDSMVVVERPMFSILEKLPPSYYKAKYGT
ncbi:hypothetical protein BZG36_00273 [Bifiguratus adelaidae]|uniref:Uncharacterized protein n=1 Tax=Bifiguratus adelaidae TaxID=1938954 RepID=A0A261Y7S3_9FUNG|nr:hypothetical protein BZG36_00273 [Bifiguratus adelaidae]